MVSWMRWAALTWSAVARCVAPLKLGTPAGSSAARLSPALNALNANVSFYWPAPRQDENCDPDHTWGALFEDTKDHPWKTTSEDNATFSLKCMRPPNETAYLELPKRREGQFYLFWGLKAPLYKTWSEAMRSRQDFIFTSFDRRMDTTNRADPIPGVTLPAVFLRGINFRAYDPAVPPEYFLTFRGNLNPGFDMHENHSVNMTRPILAHDFMQYAGEPGEKVVFEVPREGETDPGNSHFLDLMNSAYVLVPSGHHRWSYRLTEVVLSCAIPVIVANGLTMPYEDVIDWRSFAIFADGAVNRSKRTGAKFFSTELLDPQTLLNMLPRDPAEIARRRQMACDVGRAYFSNAHNRLEALLQSAAVHGGLLKAETVRDARVPPVSSGEIRFVPKKLRRASDVHSARITRVEFMYDGKLVDMQEANVTDDQEDQGAINVRFGKESKLHYFRFYTSSDHEDLDPVEWEVLTVARSGIWKQEWWLHQTANNTSTPTARNSPTQWFRLTKGARLR